MTDPDLRKKLVVKLSVPIYRPRPKKIPSKWDLEIIDLEEIYNNRTKTPVDIVQ